MRERPGVVSVSTLLGSWQLCAYIEYCHLMDHFAEGGFLFECGRVLGLQDAHEGFCVQAANTTALVEANDATSWIPHTCLDVNHQSRICFACIQRAIYRASIELPR